MKTLVISLGGSVILPDKPDLPFIDNFKRIVRKHYKKYRFVIVCGGGSIARKYINSLEKEGKSEKELAFAGIRVTRMNAQFLMQIFGKEANDSLPINMEQVKSNLNKNNIVFCGALRYAVDETSDGTAAKLAHFLKTDFINLTNVSGLYTSDPKKNKNAKLIRLISWKNFEKIALSIKFHAGQHFVLDQQAAKIIKKNKIETFIIGNLKSLDNLLKEKSFAGTKIFG